VSERQPERVETERLVLRRPRPDDAEAIFTRYASDPEVTRYLSFPRHASLENTRAFLALSDADWSRWPAGPYLIERRDRSELIGSTGLSFETGQRAATGYLLAREAWGRGYATEARDRGRGEKRGRAAAPRALQLRSRPVGAGAREGRLRVRRHAAALRRLPEPQP
jgi:RimJ/RimL family protein N-acetyltransferase